MVSLNGIRAALVAAVAGLLSYGLSAFERLKMRYVERKALARKRHYGLGRYDRAQTSPAGGLVDTILAIGIAGVVGYVMLQIGSDTESSAGFDTSQDAANRTAFENASASITGGFETAFSLLDVVFIAFMLAIIVGALLGLRRRRQ